jgi:hypothetical protein
VEFWLQPATARKGASRLAANRAENWAFDAVLNFRASLRVRIAPLLASTGEAFITDYRGVIFITVPP